MTTDEAVLIGGPAALRIRYSDESRGVLTVSCTPVGTPAPVFEGVTTTKGYIDHLNREKPVFRIDADPPNFHVMDKP